MNHIRPAKKRVVLFTTDLKGPFRNGGVGTATHGIALLHAKNGDDVTVYFCEKYSDDEDQFHLHQIHYEAFGVRLQSLSRPAYRLEPVREYAEFSYRAYQALKAIDADVVYFPDMRGLGFHSLSAKRQGLAFPRTEMRVFFNGPSEWGRENSGLLPDNPRDITIGYLERKTVEWADVLIMPSTYALNWAKAHAWKLPSRTIVARLPFHFETKPKSNHFLGIDEIVFFGRLEPRKGLDVFCDALQSIDGRAEMNGVQVTFLGREISSSGWTSRTHIRRRTYGWSMTHRMITTLGRDEALEYLARGRSLAVMPSLEETMGYVVLECLSLGVPFLCSNLPPFMDLIPKDRLTLHCVTPERKALSKKILSALRTPVETWRNLDLGPNGESPAGWEELLAPVRPAPARRRSTVAQRVSVVVAPTTRRDALNITLRHFARASVAPLEIIAARANAAPPGVKYVAVPPGLSRSGLKNHLASYARGDILLFVDAGDIPHADEIERLRSVAANSSADAVACGFQTVDAPEGVLPTRWIPLGPDLATSLLKGSVANSHVAITARAFRQLGGFRIGPNGAEEGCDLLARAAIAGLAVEACPDPLFYRGHTDLPPVPNPSVAFDQAFRLAGYANLLAPLGFNNFAGWATYAYSLMHLHLPPSQPVEPPQRSDIRDLNHLPAVLVAPVLHRSLPLPKSVGLRLTEKGRFFVLHAPRGGEIHVLLPRLEPGYRGFLSRMDLASFREGRIETVLLRINEVRTICDEPIVIGKSTLTTPITDAGENATVVFRFHGTFEDLHIVRWDLHAFR